MRWAPLLLLVASCGGPAPSVIASQRSVGIESEAALEAALGEVAFQPEVISPGLLYDVTRYARDELAEGNALMAQRHAHTVAALAAYVLVSRPDRERLRAEAWQIEARAWEQMGYRGRASVSRIQSHLARAYLRTPQSSRDEADFARMLSDLDRAHSRRQQAQVAAGFAIATAALSQVSENLQNPEQPTTTTSEQQHALWQEANTSLTTANEMGAAADDAISAARELVTVDTPSIRTARTPLFLALRAYLQATEDPAPYLEALRGALDEVVETWTPRGIESIVGAARTATAESAMEEGGRLQAAMNLLYLAARAERSVRAVAVDPDGEGS